MNYILYKIKMIAQIISNVVNIILMVGKLAY